MRQRERTKRQPPQSGGIRPFPQYADNPPPIVAIVRDVLIVAGCAELLPEQGQAMLNHCLAFLDIIRMRAMGASSPDDPNIIIEWAKEYARPKEETANA